MLWVYFSSKFQEFVLKKNQIEELSSLDDEMTKLTYAICDPCIKTQLNQRCGAEIFNQWNEQTQHEIENFY